MSAQHRSFWLTNQLPSGFRPCPPLAALLSELLRDLTVKAGRRRVRLQRVGKYPQSLEPLADREVQKLLELCFAFAREAGNHRGPQHESVDPPPEPVQQAFCFPPRYPACHTLKHPIVDMLQG